MNILPVILALILFLNKSGAQNFLKELDINSISPLLNLLGVDGKIIDLLSSDAFKKLTSGDFDFPTLLSLVSPLISSFMQNKSGPYEPPVNNNNFQKLEPISEIAPQDVMEKLSSYFSA